MLNYLKKSVCFQEVPNEISLTFSIAGCPRHCFNCSWKSIEKQEQAKPLTNSVYSRFLNKYKGLASCVLFLGGDWETQDLITKLKMAKEKGYKTCLYTGCEMNLVHEDIKNNLDFIKVGPYVEELGGLNSPKTNQRFIDLVHNVILNKLFIQQGAF